MKHTQAAQFIARAHALTMPVKPAQSLALDRYRNHTALPLLMPFRRLIRAGVEMRLNNMQIAESLKAISGVDPRIKSIHRSTLAGYVSVIRSCTGMPNSKGFLSQW